MDSYDVTTGGWLWGSSKAKEMPEEMTKEEYIGQCETAMETTLASGLRPEDIKARCLASWEEELKRRRKGRGGGLRRKSTRRKSTRRKSMKRRKTKRRIKKRKSTKRKSMKRKNTRRRRR